jgi:transcriptional regulator with XRE-family HTH domain
MNTPRDEARRNVPRMVRTLMEARGVSLEVVASALALSKPSVSERLSGSTHIKAEEVAVLADLFGVEPGALYRDPASFFGDPAATLPTDTRSGSSVGRARA